MYTTEFLVIFPYFCAVLPYVLVQNNSSVDDYDLPIGEASSTSILLATNRSPTRRPAEEADVHSFYSLVHYCAQSQELRDRVTRSERMRTAQEESTETQNVLLERRFRWLEQVLRQREDLLSELKNEKLCAPPAPLLLLSLFLHSSRSMFCTHLRLDSRKNSLRRRLESDLQNVWEASVRRERSPRASWTASGGGGSLMRMNSMGSRLQLSGSFDAQPIVGPLGLDASTASFRGGRSVSPGGGSSGSASPTRGSALFARDPLADHRDGNPGLHWSRSMSPSGTAGGSGQQHQSRAMAAASTSSSPNGYQSPLQAQSATSPPKSSAAAASPNGTLVSSLPPIPNPKRSTSPAAPGDRSAGAGGSTQTQVEPAAVSSNNK